MTINVDNSLAKRFINAYNAIDHALRTQYNFKNNISFTDLIRRCSNLNTVIRGYEDDLISLARLRNAIVHNKSEQIIAEPHEDIVELTEKIARVVVTPPLAIEIIKSRSVSTVMASLSVGELMMEIDRVKFSNLPVYKNNALIGVVNLRKIASVQGSIIAKGERSVDDFLKHTTIEEFLHEYPANDHYHLVSSKITIEEILKLFDGNRKLACVIITKSGNFLDQPLGIITGADIFDLKEVLEGY